MPPRSPSSEPPSSCEPRSALLGGGPRDACPVVAGGLRGGELLRRAEAGGHRGAGSGQHLVMLDVEEAQPALLAHRERDKAAELDQLGLGEMPVEPLPQRVVGLQPPRDRLRVGQGGLLALAEPRRGLEVEQVVVLPLAQALGPGLLRTLVSAVLAVHRAGHVHAAELLDGVIANSVAEDRLPRPREGPEARRNVRAHRRALRPRSALAPAPFHLGPHLVVHCLDRQVADPLLAIHRVSLRRQRLRNSGERRRASATWRAVLKVLTRRRSTKPPPWTPKTDAPGWSLIEMVAYMDALLRAMTLRPPSLSTWYPGPSRRLSTMTTSSAVTFFRGTRTFGMAHSVVPFAGKGLNAPGRSGGQPGGGIGR